MQKKINLLLIIAVLTMMLAGCGAKVTELTDEENSMVSEYIASVLLKYDKNYNYRLDYEEEEVNPPTPSPTPAVMVASPTEEPKETESAETDGEAEPEEPAVVVSENLDGLYQDAGICVTPKGYEIKKSYNTDFSVIEPEKGKSLLVVSFEVSGTDGKGVSVDMLKQKETVAYTAQIDGETYEANMSIAQEDLQYYKGKIAKGKKATAVLFFEIDTKNPKEIQITGTKGETQVTVQVK